MLPDDRYRRAAAAGGVGIWDWNIVTGEVYIDPVLKEMLGYQDDEIPNTADVWHRLVHPDDKAALVAWTQAHIAGELPNTSSSIGCFIATAASDGFSRVRP